jgi:hypothetical protein
LIDADGVRIRVFDDLTFERLRQTSELRKEEEEKRKETWIDVDTAAFLVSLSQSNVLPRATRVHDLSNRCAFVFV